MAVVYWIRLPEHTDITTQGYVGITSKSFSVRLRNHEKYFNAVEVGSKKATILSRAVEKHGWDNLVKQVVLIGEKEYCLEIEQRLRPSEKIGWNIRIGGVGSSRETSDDLVEKLRLHGKAHTIAQHTREAAWAASKKLRETKWWRTSPKAINFHRVADVVYEYLKIKPDASSNEIRNATKCVVTYDSLKSVVVRIEGGWNPAKDPYWLEDFKQNNYEEFFTEDVLAFRSKVPWRSNNAIKDVWLDAENLFNLVEQGYGPAAIYKVTGFTEASLSGIRRNFRDGWNPHKDPQYKEWKDKHSKEAK